MARASALAGVVALAALLSACGSQALTLHGGIGPLSSPRSSGAGPSAHTPTPSPSMTPISPSPSLPPLVPHVDQATLRPVNGLIPALHHVPTTDKVVFITIDDGYSKDPAVIALLKSRGVVVTPFLARNAITDDPLYFKGLETATGQVPQDHTLHHLYMRTLSYAKQKQEICGAADAYAKWYGTRPWLFRPPYGSYNDETRRAAKACGMTALVLWDVSLPHAVIRYADGSRFRAGDILLVHWRPKLAHDLALTIDTIEKDGFRVAALQDYLPRPS